MTNKARHALVWLLTVHSAARTSSRTHHRNPGLDIRAIFEEGRENAKFSWHVMARARVFQPRSDDRPAERCVSVWCYTNCNTSAFSLTRNAVCRTAAGAAGAAGVAAAARRYLIGGFD